MYEQLRARETEVLILGGGSRKGADRAPAQWHLSDRQTGHRALHPPGHQSPGFRGKRGIDARGGAIIEGGDPGMTQVREDFASPAPEETLQRVAERMRERNIEVVVVDDGDQARKVVLERLPEGAEVHSGKSKTLQDAGIFDAVHDASRYDALRPRIFKMDRQTQAREIRKLISGPDFMLGSVNAVTEDGVLVAASASASQLGPYASTAGKVILVVDSQKIVPDLERALSRISDYVLPWEDAQVRKVMNIGSFVGKILLVEREWVDGRMTVILVRQPIGI